MAEAAYQAAAARLRDASAMSGTRAERLRVIDPGIVPQRPSFPNLPLNVIAAIFIALVGTIAYLSVAFSLRRKPRLRPVMTRGIGA
jgi:uncharacterized protein involved in exopolysaccharide biosynthesis